MLGNRAGSQNLIDLGNRIRIRRQEVCLSQETLAEKAGISPNTISRIEGGQTAMSVEIFQKLVRILDMDANTLLGESDGMHGENYTLSEMCQRVRRLNETEQKIVLQTMEALMDALCH